MNNPLYTISKPFLNNGLTNLNQNIKILLYKNNNKIFDVLKFEDEEIYKEPLLFAYFNNKLNNNQTLESVVCGYSEKVMFFKVFTDEFGRVYLPNIGWILTKHKQESFDFDRLNFKLFKDKKNIDFDFEKLEIIEKTKIEVIKYPIQLLKQFYFNTENNLLDVEIEDITKKQIKYLTLAYNLIKKHVPTQFEFIEKYAPKCVIFNFDTYQRNSFATLSAQGISFYNAYQEDYDEVFFVDDIAHQTGHLIFNVIIYESNLFFKKDKTTTLEIINMPDGSIVEKRDLHVIFHALYTYYTSFLCLDACLEKNAFEGKQKHEALGRIAFYISKCYRDLLLIDNPISSETKSNECFTVNGLLIYKELKQKWKEMYVKWFEKTKHFDMSNQPYNFTYSKFLELNPLK